MIKHKIFGLLLFMLPVAACFAQLNPLTAQYFNNRYLINPAFAGAQQDTRLNMVYRSQWNNIPGAPITQSLTLDHGFEKVGLGLNVSNDKAGLIRQTNIAGSFAYHLPLGETDRLSFGISMGFTNQRINQGDIIGNQGDVLVGRYNDRETYLDGSFGAAYTASNLTLQASIPNLKQVFKRDITYADLTSFYTAASYKINLEGGEDASSVEPLVAYRGVYGYDNMWDAGAQLNMSGQLLLSTIYHSTKSATFGVGMDFRKKYLVTAQYTSNTSVLNSYSNGSFELNLRLRF
ncbi:PorP/SprF family type IX secretion system membrane protein [Pedobacter sp. AW1-32]|uniref:PorP/SprF family type IX secretion system membrane protein n=1 Tax=Pedobacter sp. AW1-32 TaxID=3383026 RepID=UPI003FEF40D7